MAFFGKVGSILRQASTKPISSDFFSVSKSVLSQAIRCMSNKIFIGGLPYSMDEQSLRETFGKYGDIDDTRVIRDRETGNSRGFGFITYTSSEAASSAIQALDGQDLQGRRVRVNFATERPRTFNTDNNPYGGGSGGGGYNNSYGGGYNNNYGGNDFSSGGDRGNYASPGNYGSNTYGSGGGNYSSNFAGEGSATGGSFGTGNNFGSGGGNFSGGGAENYGSASNYNTPSSFGIGNDSASGGNFNNFGGNNPNTYDANTSGNGINAGYTGDQGIGGLNSSTEYNGTPVADGGVGIDQVGPLEGNFREEAEPSDDNFAKHA